MSEWHEMTKWHKIQSSVSQALSNLNSDLPEGLKPLKGGVLPEKRFNVYRNNVTLSLISVMASTYPVIEEIVGVDFFATMAREFSLSHLPQSPVMIKYGAEFPQFLQSFQPVETLAYLSEIAQLEWQRNSAYHGADANPIAINALSEFAEDDLLNLTFTLHPTFSLISSTYPIVSIWQAHQEENPAEQLAGISMQEGEAALIVRPGLDVIIQKISTGTHKFLECLTNENSFSLSVEQAIAIEPTFDIPANLAGLFNSGAVTGLQLTTKS